MTTRSLPFKIMLDDSLIEPDSLFQIHVDVTSRSQLTRRLLEVLGDRFDEEFDDEGIVPSFPGHPLGEVLGKVDRAAVMAWELDGARPKDCTPPAFVVLQPTSKTSRPDTPVFWMTFDRQDLSTARRPVASIEVHAESRTMLVVGLLWGLHLLFDPAMKLRRDELSPDEEARSFRAFLQDLGVHPARARAATA